MKEQQDNNLEIGETVGLDNVSTEATMAAETAEAAEAAERQGGEERELGVAEETYKEMSPLRLILRRFFRSKLSIVGLVMIVALFLFSFLGPIIYNAFDNVPWIHEAHEQNLTLEEAVDRSYHVELAPPTPQTMTDLNGNTFTVTEVVELENNTGDANKLMDPGEGHLLGTDDKGMDVFVRLMYGGRISLIIGFIVVILETLIGIVIGGISGYFGGWIDNILMRVVDIFNCIPTLPSLLIGSFVIDSWGLQPDQQIYVLMVIITLFGWSGTARLVRGQILGLREQEYITATEVMGFSPWRRIFKHLIPNVMPQLIVSMTLGLGSVILYESTLSYLGLGVQLPKAAWGTMIALAKTREVLIYHMNVWLPAGILIVIAVLGFNFIGDGLRDAMDPKARK